MNGEGVKKEGKYRNERAAPVGGPPRRAPFGRSSFRKGPPNGGSWEGCARMCEGKGEQHDRNGPLMVGRRSLTDGVLAALPAAIKAARHVDGPRRLAVAVRAPIPRGGERRPGRGHGQGLCQSPKPAREACGVVEHVGRSRLRRGNEEDAGEPRHVLNCGVLQSHLHARVQSTNGCKGFLPTRFTFHSSVFHRKRSRFEPHNIDKICRVKSRFCLIPFGFLVS
jgi:hypothetical protein